VADTENQPEYIKEKIRELQNLQKKLFYPQILSRDSVTVSVDAVVYFNVIDSEQALCSVDDFSHSTRLLAATTLRNVLGTKVKNAL
jgi:regulator of protease activity HflC (stomatin/prohibitin superfamily)